MGGRTRVQSSMSDNQGGKNPVPQSISSSQAQIALPQPPVPEAEPELGSTWEISETEPLQDLRTCVQRVGHAQVCTWAARTRTDPNGKPGP